MKKKQIVWWKMVILLFPIIPSVIFFVSPFDRTDLIYSNSSITYSNDSAPYMHIDYVYYADDIVKNQDATFYIESINIKSPTPISSFFNNLLNVVGIGWWHDVCFNTIKSKVYIGEYSDILPSDSEIYKTNIKNTVIYTIYNKETYWVMDSSGTHKIDNLTVYKDIGVKEGRTKCILYNTKNGIRLVINNKMSAAPENDLKKYLDLNPIQQKENYTYRTFNFMESKAYVKHNMLVIIIVNILLILVWFGILMTIKEIKKWIYN